MSDDGLASVRRALDILGVLGDRPSRVQEVATAIGREKTQVSRTLKVLAEAGFIERDPETLEYRPGWRVFTLARSAGDTRLTGHAPRVLRELMLELGEPAYLTVLQGSAAMTVATEHPSRSLQTREWIGRITPLNCTASGRTLLFDVPDADVVALLGDEEPFGGTTRAPRTRAEVIDRLRHERIDGYVAVSEEYEPGLVSVAAPVRDFTGHTVAAVNVSAPVFRMPPEALTPVVDAVRTAAERLSVDVGGHTTGRRARPRRTPGRPPEQT